MKERPDRKTLVRLYTKEGRSIRDIALRLECSKDLVARAMKEYGITARPKAGISQRQSQLTKYRLKDLEASIKRQGVRATARELGVWDGTLRHYLKVTKKSHKTDE